MKILNSILFGCMLFLLFPGSLSANNISVSNVTLTGATSTTVLVQFDLSWDNSWRLSAGPANWDAAWVFVKFSASGGSGPWEHATLNPGSHTAPAGSTITTSPDSTGVFIYRDADGSGTNSWTGVQLRWNFGVDGLGDVSSAVVQVFAIEMVYIPQGEFAAGSGGTESNAFTLTTINTADATVTPSGTGALGGEAGGYPTGQSAPTQANWPNGYNAFYIMKYEASEEQWVSFFNTLTLTQMASRDITNSSGKNSDGTVGRNTVSWTTGFATTAAPDRACNFLNWEDAAAYLDWAALRPMTELEYEKACRGAGQAPVANEYVWGNTGIYAQIYSIANAGAPNEVISNPGTSVSEGNAIYSLPFSGYEGPLRCGIFAASASDPERPLVGGTYYGVMEMAGNLEEFIANIGSGASYDGVHGDGNLAINGEADVSGWPTLTGGFGWKGGAWNLSSQLCRISDRNLVSSGNTRSDYTGLRGVRSAP